MKYLSRFIKWFSIVVLVLFTGVVIFIHTIDFSPEEKFINSVFSSIDHTPEYKSFIYNHRKISYVAIGDSSKPVVLFVHGSPGSWDNFLGFLADSALLENFRMLALDRPGYGESGDGEPERSLKLQSEYAIEVLKQENTDAIVVGHSYAGPVIVKMGIDYPELVKGLVMVAGSVDPDLEETKWFQIPVHYKALSWILPGMLYSSNEEILALKLELELMEPEWRSVTQPVSIIQGGKDKLVPKENADYAQRMLVNAPVVMIEEPEMNHFVPWSNPELITQEIFRIHELLQAHQDEN